MTSWASLRQNIDPYVYAPMNRVRGDSEPIFPTTDYERFVGYQYPGYGVDSLPIPRQRQASFRGPESNRAQQFLMSVGTIVLVISLFF
jgi:hypothetical protein